ncbi:MAG TPA: hypothetical protein VLX92_09095, partial [Kofleriaceae bacterium]|nr:hypothetical protein [Kofleriaceae bacterium]
VEGRIHEATFTRDGRIVTVGELDDALAELPTGEHVVSYQLEQRDDGVRLRATASGPVDRAGFAAALRARYGAPAEVELVAALEPAPSGKYPRVRQLMDRRGPAA